MKNKTFDWNKHLYMNLGELVKILEKEDLKKVVKFGFHRPHSYRGYYEDLAFEPKENVTVAEMLRCAKSSLGKTFTGWKGGDFEMGEHTSVWISTIGNSGGDKIGPLLLAYMLSYDSIKIEDDNE